MNYTAHEVIPFTADYLCLAAGSYNLKLNFYLQYNQCRSTLLASIPARGRINFLVSWELACLFNCY